MEKKELERIIERLGVRQLDIARGIGVSEAAVSRWLNGRSPITRPMAYAIRAWAKSYKKAG